MALLGGAAAEYQKGPPPVSCTGGGPFAMTTLFVGSAFLVGSALFVGVS